MDIMVEMFWLGGGIECIALDGGKGLENKAARDGSFAASHRPVHRLCSKGRGMGQRGRRKTMRRRLTTPVEYHVMLRVLRGSIWLHEPSNASP